MTQMSRGTKVRFTPEMLKAIGWEQGTSPVMTVDGTWRSTTKINVTFMSGRLRMQRSFRIADLELI